MRKVIFVLLLSFVMGSLLSSANGKSHNWPAIKAISWSGDIDLLGPPSLVVIPAAKGGKVLYRLYCSSRLAPPEPNWLTQGDNYGGDFECLLTDSSPGMSPERATLLNYVAEDKSPYHTNLGSFTWEELQGTCRNDPVWGTSRSLYLRGMRLRISVVGARIEEYNDKKQAKKYPIIRRVSVKIDAAPDPTAETELARKPAQPEPPECSTGGPRFPASSVLCGLPSCFTYQDLHQVSGLHWARQCSGLSCP